MTLSIASVILQGMYANMGIPLKSEGFTGSLEDYMNSPKVKEQMNNRAAIAIRQAQILINPGESHDAERVD